MLNGVKKILLSLMMLTVIAAGTSLSFASEATTLFAYVGAGLKGPASELAALYEKKTGVKIEMTFNSSGALLSQLELTKKGDIYMPGAMSFVMQAKGKGYLGEMVGPLAYHVPVIITPKGNPAQISGITDLAKPGIQLIMPDQQGTALGKTAFKIFTKLDIAKEVQKNILASVETGPKVMATMMMGQGNAGISEYSEAFKNQDQLELILIDPAVNEAEEIPCAMLTCTRQKGAALAFLKFVKQEGPKVFASHGFKVNR